MGIKLTQHEKELIIKNQKYIQNNDWDGFSDSFLFSLSSDDDEFAHIFQFCLECVPDLLYKITYIPDSAFSNSDIKSINIPSNIKRIESGAFYYCIDLENATIPDSVTQIEAWTFYGCASLKHISIPNSVTEIGDCAFAGCNSLKSVDIPDSVTKIGWHSFECENLKRISISKHLEGRDFLQDLPKDCKIEVRE